MIKLGLIIVAVLTWGGAVLWYFHKDIHAAWTNYRLRWTRSD